MYATDALDLDERRPRRLGLTALLLALAALGAGLYAIAGPPHPPPAWPSGREVLATLRGSEPPLAAMGYLLTTAAWLVWLWVVGSLVLRCALLAAEALSHCARWTRALRRFSDRATLPLVRRVVDGALVAVVVVQLAARAPTAAAAEPTAPSAVAAATEPRPATAAPPAASTQPMTETPAISYTVQPGDNLWTIAERCYGDGGEYRRLLAANVGRTMPDGRRFDDTGLIRPGWVLRVPLPAARLEQADGATFYAVGEGDSLRAVAARFLGDEMRWPSIFELNRGHARLADGRTLENPDLIWPGLRLRLPIEAPTRPATPMRAPDRDDAGLRRPATPAPAAAPAPAAPTPAPTLPPPQPTPAPAQPTMAPTATTVAVAPTPVPTAVAGAAAHSARATLLYGVGPVLGGAAVVGTGMYLGRRHRRRRSLDEPPPPEEPAGDAVLRDGFAETELARTLAHRLHGELDPATLVAGRVRRFYAEHGVDLGIVTVRHGRRRSVLTVAAKLDDQPRLGELAEELGRRLGVRVRAEPAAQNDVQLTLSGLARASLSATPDDASDAPWLLPVGALPTGEVVHVDWRELDHVLVAGLPGEGAETVLTSLVAGLAARCRPDELRLRTIAHRHALPPELEELPHQLGGLVDPADAEAVRAVVGETRAELERRIQAGETAAPRLVLVVAELAEVDGGQLATIGEYGPAHGVHLLAASTRAAELGTALLGHFRTRAVLRLGGEAESTRLLGEAGAEQLDDGGDLFLSVDARPPVRLRGLRVPSEHLAELVRLMRTGYAVAATAPVAATPTDAPPIAEPESSQEESDVETEAPVILAPADEPAADAATTASVAASVDVEPEHEAVHATHPNGAVALPLPLEVEPQEMAPGLRVPTDGHVPIDRAATATDERLTTDGAGEAEGTGDAPPVEVVCFGEPRVLHLGKRIWPPDPSRLKAWELLLFLAVQPDGQATRDQLWDALWPDKNPHATADPSNALRTQLHRLREAFEERAPGVGEFVVLQRNGGPCSLDPAVVCSDVHRFVALCEEAKSLPPREAKAAYRQARALYGDELLGGQPYPWIAERDESGLTLGEMYAEMYRRATKELADLLLREGEAAAAIPLYRELLEPDPTLESLVRSLFRCYRQLGDRSALIREERHLRALLEKRAAEAPDLPAEPEPKTVALFEKALAELDTREPAVAAG